MRSISQINILFKLERYSAVDFDLSCSSMIKFESATITSPTEIDVVSLFVSNLGERSSD